MEKSCSENLHSEVIYILSNILNLYSLYLILNYNYKVYLKCYQGCVIDYQNEAFMSDEILKRSVTNTSDRLSALFPVRRPSLSARG